MNTKDLATVDAGLWKSLSDFPFVKGWFDDFTPQRIDWMNSKIHPIRVEEFVKNDEIVIRVELPGIDPDKDVHIDIRDGLLTVSGERKEELKTEKRSEFYYGSFTRTIALPTGATDKGVKALYKDGILEVRVPTPQEMHQAKRIMIEKG